MNLSAKIVVSLILIIGIIVPSCNIDNPLTPESSQAVESRTLVSVEVLAQNEDFQKILQANLTEEELEAHSLALKEVFHVGKMTESEVSVLVEAAVDIALAEIRADLPQTPSTESVAAPEVPPTPPNSACVAACTAAYVTCVLVVPGGFTPCTNAYRTCLSFC